MAQKVIVQLCMGSSCFARGNSMILQAIEEFIGEKGLGDRIEIEGHLCMGNCKAGPNIRIDGVDCSVSSPEEAIALIVKALEE